ncbi:hypothetical protein [Streptomyces sp. CB02400]|uniref:hypothetical protein n=1 Tax=unclassified Streptomyces TaxID=2593676 RepID=UPI001161045E|nr:hypothetical protein [Streptomyces sp. CB02400]
MLRVVSAVDAPQGQVIRQCLVLLGIHAEDQRTVRALSAYEPAVVERDTHPYLERFVLAAHKLRAIGHPELTIITHDLSVSLGNGSAF